MANHNLVIDVMKAFGILSVVTFHCLGELGLSQFHSFNMPLFFLLAGWVGVPKLPIEAVIKRLAVRLVYVYLLYNVIVVIAKYLFSNFSSSSPMFGVPDFLWNPALAPMQISWFLYFLFLYKGIHAILICTFKNNDIFSINVFFIVLVLFVKFLFSLLGVNEPVIVTYSFFYFSGACLFYLPKNLWNSNLNNLGLFVLIIVLMSNFVKNSSINSLLFSSLGILGVFSLSNILITWNYLSKILLFIGKRTMEIYLFHYFIQVAFRGYFITLPPVVGFTVLFGISVLGSLLLAMLIEKWTPGRKILLGKL